jgi:hypothetical protein
MVNVKASVLASRVSAPMPDRWSGVYANPVGNYQDPNRGTPRVTHPKLNTTPWSTSYAVKRKPMRKSASKKAGKG